MWNVIFTNTIQVKNGEKLDSMGFFYNIFNRQKDKKTEVKKYIDDAEAEKRRKDFMVGFEQVKDLFISSLNIYNSDSCQCAYPRFQQIISIDCRKSGDSFKCYDTELLIGLSKAYFNVEKSELTDECSNEKWTCKKCGSIYEYGWSDFSIYVEREKLKLISLNVETIGKSIIKPIPLFLGLTGHSYPSLKDIARVEFEDFEKYMTEQ